jgi:hypothetical protein
MSLTLQALPLRRHFKWRGIFTLEEDFEDSILDSIIIWVFALCAMLIIGRDCLGSGIYFCTYDSTKYLLSGSSIPGSLIYAISGGVCGVISWCIVFPMDTAKVSRLGFQIDE